MNRLRLAFAAALALATLAPAHTDADANGAATPSAGALRALSPDRTPLGQCPLEHTDVSMDVSGSTVHTRVTQRFSNPFDEPIEAVYVFPLPENAAVDAMQMRIGDRVVQSQIMRREAARETYEAARNQGQTASLLEQERPNIFTTSVANIRPGHPIEVTMEYVATVPYESGTYELAFPMTVGPRFIPGEPTGARGTGYAADTDRVPDASRITPPVAPTGRSGHDISVRVNLDAGIAMAMPSSPSHDLSTRRLDDSRVRVDLASHDSIPNKDFVLRWEVAPERVSSGVLAHRPDASEPGYLSLVLHPNPAPPTDEITPKEIVFVLDTSGSMSGQPMELSKRLMRNLISDLHPRDTFGVLRYDSSTSALSPTPLENTPANRQRALQYVENLSGSGGTDALAGVRAAFDYPRDTDRLRIVVFLSDGYIGNDREILAEVQRRIGDARLFGFGVGSSVNRYLLEEMGRVGRGTTAIVTLDQDPVAQVDDFYHRLQSPYLTDIRVDWGNLRVRSTFPDPIPDLFAGQPLTLHGRYRRAGTGTITVRGRLAGRPFRQTLEVTLPDEEQDHAAIASLWARARVAELERQMHDGPNERLEEELTQVALDHSLVTRKTSFVAVERRVVTDPEGGPPRLVAVPAELPDGVSADGVFGSDLSLARFQPGDPELRVEAPSDALSVTADFPFGDTKELHFEPRLGKWTTRFLVPRATAEGNYHIQIVITLADGTQERLSQAYTVDSSAPDVDVELVGDPSSGTVLVVAKQRFTEADHALHGNRRVDILSDVARLRVTLPSGERLQLRMVEPGHWEGELAVADDADSVELRVTAYDVAGNRGTRTHRFEVAELEEERSQ
ncbi:MAG: VWA domain-containing protein [Deltaproteobacteria bacterium]|nr:VWA domain-containing protein [Deltaproteobacteria bacterium]